MRTNANIPGVPADLVRPRAFQTVPTNMATLRDIQDRLGFQADGTWYARAAGQHTLKAGVQFDRIGNDVYNGYQQQRVLFYWGDSYAATDGTLYPSPYGYARAYYIATTGDIRSDNWGLFVQDSWTIADRFTLNLGLRSESEKVPSFSECRRSSAPSMTCSIWPLPGCVGHTENRSYPLSRQALACQPR